MNYGRFVRSGAGPVVVLLTLVVAVAVEDGRIAAVGRTAQIPVPILHIKATGPAK